MWRMYKARKDYVKLRWLRNRCSAILGRYFRAKFMRRRFRETLFGKRDAAATLVQKYLRGYKVGKIDEWERKFAYYRMKRASKQLDKAIRRRKETA